MDSGSAAQPVLGVFPMKTTFLASVAVLSLLYATGAHTEANVLGCFARVYDKAHLAEHPDQLVTSVTIRHLIEMHQMPRG
jgi:hypothetical protein